MASLKPATLSPEARSTLRRLRDRVESARVASPGITFVHVIAMRIGPRAKTPSALEWARYAEEWAVHPFVMSHWGINQAFRPAKPDHGIAEYALLSNVDAKDVFHAFVQDCASISTKLSDVFARERIGTRSPEPHNWYNILEYLYYIAWYRPDAVFYRVDRWYWNDEPLPQYDPWPSLEFMRGDGFREWREGRGPKTVRGLFTSTLSRDVRECLVDGLDAILAGEEAHLGDTQDRPARMVDRSPNFALVLGGRGEAPIVGGNKHHLLSVAQYDVVKALCDAGAGGLSLDQLRCSSKHEDARNILLRLARSHPDWEAIISFPGIPGVGYRILGTTTHTNPHTSTLKSPGTHTA